MYNNYLWGADYGVPPKTAISTNDRVILQNYYRKYFFYRAMSVYKWELPEAWNKDYFLGNLYNLGFIDVLYTWQYGWIPQKCALTGYDVFDSPSGVLITNQFLGTIERKFGDGTHELFKFNPDYSGIADLIDDYSSQVAEMRLSLYANLVNTKISYILAVPNKSTGELVGAIIDEVLNGKPAVITKMKDVQDLEWFTQNVKQSYIVNDLLVDIRKVINLFDSEIGIPNANVEKKERMNTDEVNSNNGDTKCKGAFWLERFQESCKRVNALAGEKLMSVEWRKEVRDDEIPILESAKRGKTTSDSRRAV